MCAELLCFFIVFDDELKVSESCLVEDVWKACGDTWLSAMEAKMEVEIVVCNGMVTCETDVTFLLQKDSPLSEGWQFMECQYEDFRKTWVILSCTL